MEPPPQKLGRNQHMKARKARQRLTEMSEFAERTTTTKMASDRAPTLEDVIAVISGLAPELRARGVAQLSLFGSVLHTRATPGSDIDLLLDLQEGVEISLIDRLKIRDMIADALAHPVDLVPRKALIAPLRTEIEAEAQPILV